MSRDLTRRRHGRHRSFDRVRQPAGDSRAFIEAETVRLDPSEGQLGLHDSMHLVQGEGSFSTFEQVQAATDPADIGLTPSFPAQTTSIEFNGIDEAMRNQTEQGLGFGTVWSILINLRRRGDTVGLTGVNTILQLFGTPTANRIFIDGDGAEANDPIVVETHSSGGALNKRFLWNSSIFPFDVWLQMILVWNNTGTSLTMYKNGALVAPSTTTTNGTGTMSSTNRRVQIGANGGVQPFSGHIHSIALYNADVGSAAAELYNGGTVSSLDLNAASFNANLSHWWRLGQDPSDLGKDSGIAATLIDVGQDLLNIDASDIDSESPL